VWFQSFTAPFFKILWPSARQANLVITTICPMDEHDRHFITGADSYMGEYWQSFKGGKFTDTKQVLLHHGWTQQRRENLVQSIKMVFAH
jgi:hypothetical protein